MSQEPPVLDDWDGYVFPEESLDTQRDRITVRDPMGDATAGTYAPFRLDSPIDGEAATMMNTLIAVNKHLLDPQAVAELALNGTESDVRWFLFSPYEVFLEQVLAERMKTLEIGELR